MNQEKITQLVGMIQALDGKIDAFKDEVGSRFNDLEQRMTSLEGAVAGAARPVLLGAPPRAASPVVRNSGYGTNPLPRRECYRAPQPALETSVHRAAPSAKAIGSTSNATFLPFAIERIAKKHQQKFADDKRHCSFCGTETFSLSCFRLDHFRWCRVHQRPVLPPHNNCGRDYQGCEQVKWEVHPDWDTIVAMSYSAGLGNKSVGGLNEHLFPREHFSDKYDRNDQFRG